MATKKTATTGGPVKYTQPKPKGPTAADVAADAAARHAKADKIAKDNGLGQYRTTAAADTTAGSVATEGLPARNILLAQLKAWGIDTSKTDAGSLANTIDTLVKNGTFSGTTTGDTMQLFLQDTPEWKNRFAGNDARVKAGLSALSPAEYLATEDSYQQVLRAAGLPPGFYDDPSDFAGLIGKNVSPNEVNARASAAVATAKNTDPAFRQMLSQYGYNLDEGQLAAYMLDPNRALPTIQRQLDAAKVGSVASHSGFGLSTTQAESVLDLGMSDNQLRSAYSQAGQVVQGGSKLGAVYGDAYNGDDAQSEFVYGDQNAAAKRARLVNKEQSGFSGSSGAGKGSLGQNSGSY